MTDPSDPARIDWEDAYENAAHIPGSDVLPSMWAEQAAAYRGAATDLQADIAYGDAPRQRLDLVLPDGTPKGLAVFVHGGYWLRFSKSDWTHFAEGARAAGWAVALPGYTLAPEARLPQMTAEIGAAIAKAAAHVPGPIHLAGHSAGGHLVTRMICQDTPLPASLQTRVTRVLSISGVHDLRPLMRTARNASLRLDRAVARAESPALQDPLPHPRVTAWVGGAERPEFIRQSQILHGMWRSFDTQIDLVIDGLHNHFTVIDALRQSDSPLTRAWLS